MTAAAKRAPLVHLIAVALTVAMAIVALVYWVKALSELGARASTNSGLSYADREIAGGDSVVIDTQTPYRALALIPRNSSYRVVTGSRLESPRRLTLSFVADWFRYFLMPLRPSPDARWVICYGCDRTQVGPDYSLRWSDKNGISIGRVR